MSLFYQEQNIGKVTCDCYYKKSSVLYKRIIASLLLFIIIAKLQRVMQVAVDASLIVEWTVWAPW